MQPLPPEDPKSALAAFTVPKQADAIWADIEKDLQQPGVHDVTAKFGPRLVKKERCDYLRPDRRPLRIARNGHRQEGIHVPVRAPWWSARRRRCWKPIGPTLVCSAITEDPKFQRALLDATHIDRLNIGPIPTIQLNWLQPHEGNIVDFLFRARAFQFDKDGMKV